MCRIWQLSLAEMFLVKLSAAEMCRGLFCPVLSRLNVAEPYLNAWIVSVWVQRCGVCVSQIVVIGWVTML